MHALPMDTYTFCTSLPFEKFNRIFMKFLNKFFVYLLHFLTLKEIQHRAFLYYGPCCKITNNTHRDLGINRGISQNKQEANKMYSLLPLWLDLPTWSSQTYSILTFHPAVKVNETFTLAVFSFALLAYISGSIYQFFTFLYLPFILFFIKDQTCVWG